MTRTTAKEVIYKVEEVKNIMHENIEKATENCVKLESIERTSEELMKDAGIFQIHAKQLRSKLWWQNMKIWFLISGFVTIILGIFVTIIYFITINNGNNNN